MTNSFKCYDWDMYTGLGIANLCLTYILSALLVSFLYLPFGDNGNLITTVEVNTSIADVNMNGSHHVTFAFDEDNEFSFNIVFYLGLFVGSFIGGTASYFLSPGKSAAFFSKMCCLTCIIAANIMDGASKDAMGMSTAKWAWFCMCSFALAGYLSTYVHTLESVPGPWLVPVSLGLLGVHWLPANLYSLLLLLKLDTWCVRLFVHGGAILTVIALQDIISQPRNINNILKRETLTDLRRNNLGIRYLLCFSFLWVLHGYMYYCSHHKIYDDKTGTKQTFKSSIICIFKLSFAALCYWTRQQIPVMAVLFFCNSLSCFALMAFHSIATKDNDSHMDITLQLISFLTSCSWCILWAITVQSFGSGVRYAILPFCCNADI